MRVLAREAAAAGAIGFSTSRTLNHRSSKGAPTPSLTAEVDELVGISMGLKDAGRGVLELISDFADLDDEFSIVERMAAASGRPISISLAQGLSPNGWKKILGRIQTNVVAGRVMRGQVAPRPIGIVLGLSTTLNPLLMRPSYMALAKLPLADRVARLQEPAVKAKILAEEPLPAFERMKRLIGDFDRIWLLERSTGLRARAGRCSWSARAASGSRAARSGVRPFARQRRPPTAVHAVCELLAVQLGLLPRNDFERRLRTGARRRWGARRHDLRCELFDLPARALGPRPHAR